MDNDKIHRYPLKYLHKYESGLKIKFYQTNHIGLTLLSFLTIELYHMYEGIHGLD